jgi:hypothetical protein
LLVVLKQLLDIHKAQKRPMKIILNSVTINPTLFQEYFKDEHGVPAPVIEVPGRSFPVVKHFLDEIIPVLSNPRRGASRVFREESVQKYVEHRVGSGSAMGLGHARAHSLFGIDDLDLSVRRSSSCLGCHIGLTIFCVVVRK